MVIFIGTNIIKEDEKMSDFEKATPLPNTPQYNTYVGARYVPLYDGEWDATKKYEPLTVVQFEGRSYTSKTFVAAGIPVTNANFWALSGEYNGQVGQLQEQVNEIQTNLDSLTADIAEDVGNLQTNINQVANNVTNLQTTVNNNANKERLITNSHLLAGKRVYLIGDSITAGNDWSNTLKNWLQNTGGTLNNASISGASVVGMWNEVISKLTSFPYDVFILQGGINDLHSGAILGKTDGSTANSLYWGLTNIFKKIISLNPNCTLVVIGAGNLASTQTQYKYRLARIFGYAMEGCTKAWGGIYIDLGSMPGQTQKNSHGSMDHLHPTDYFANNVMGQMIIDAINSGGIPCSDLTIELPNNYIAGLITPVNGITISSYICYVNKESWIIYLYYSGTAGAEGKICDIAPGWIPNDKSYNIATSYAGTAIVDMANRAIRVLSSDGLVCAQIPNMWSGIAN